MCYKMAEISTKTDDNQEYLLYHFSKWVEIFRMHAG